ncbi:hypothetical protein GOV14_03250 [Candidatus Pacearchaeota archaeon]|nr:hypothetical protein [Candidatus Pacearchaeota archaeon]
MKIKKLHGLGNHLMLDGYSEAEIHNTMFIENILMGIVKQVKMNAISKPLVINHTADDNLESGITGVIILAESSITIHTYPNKKWFTLDIYSCNEFDIGSAINFLVDKLKVTKYKKQIIMRGEDI